MSKENNLKPEQFPLNEILNEDERLVRGWASVETKDRDGEIIPVNSEIKKVIRTWMDRGSPITDQHTNRVVGKGLGWGFDKHPKKGVDAVWIDYKIFKNYTTDDEVWEKIKSGEHSGLSFGGRSNKTGGFIQAVGGLAKSLLGMEMFEVASVPQPSSPLALNTHINYLAKSENSKGGNNMDEITKLKAENYDLRKQLNNKSNDESQDESVKTKEMDSDTAFDEGYIAGEGSCEDGNKSKSLNSDTHKENISKDSPSNSQDDKPSINKKTTEVSNMGTKNTKKEGEEIPTPEERLSELEQKMGLMSENIDKILKSVSKEREEDDEDKPEDEMKQDDEDKPEDTEKEGNGEDVKLPKASAGETDETAQEEGDKVQLLEKAIKAEVAKQMKTLKASTPRVGHEVQKSHETKQEVKPLNGSFIQKMREGKISPNMFTSMMTQEIKKEVKKNSDVMMDEFKKTMGGQK